MIPRGRWVVDTNILVGQLLLPRSFPARAVRQGIQSGDLLVSDDTLQELAEVLARPKFDRYLLPEDRETFFQLLSRVAIHIEILHLILACRDPKDDKFLTLAINGHADALITGDADLLALHPFRGIPILSPGDFLAREPGKGFH